MVYCSSNVSQRLLPLYRELQKAMRSFFFRVDEHRDYISRSYRWTRRVNEPRFYANATRVNAVFLARFCTVRRRLTPATFLSASNSERSFLGAAIRGSSRSIICPRATSAADFTRYMPFFTAASIRTHQ